MKNLFAEAERGAYLVAKLLRTERPSFGRPADDSLNLSETAGWQGAGSP
jgi:hypothetical protein